MLLFRCRYEGVIGFVFRAGLRGESGPSGLGGRLLIRVSFRGGCGKELMLTVFRRVLAGVAAVETARG